ncbi:MAG: NACHT domain-containing protein [Flavobacterium sp.]|nr:NACHT domain-containing protein [Flavobacterium sp.]
MITATIGIQLINAFKEPILKLGKEIKDEFLDVFNNGLSDFVDNFYNKYSKTKTFIYRDEKVNFYDIFYPVTLKSNSEKISEINDLKTLFNERKYITIIGMAGCGKSMLMKHIFLSTVNQFYSIPIVIELRNLNDFNGTITDYITKLLTKNKLSNNERITERILSEGNFIFLLDGYDEIYSENKDKITNDIEEFVDTYSRNTFVLTSRPGANAESLQRFDNFYVQPLSNKQINEFINLQFKLHDNKESIGKIISVIEKTENRDYKDYLSNPLLLSMFIFTFNTYPELPKSKNKFYWNVFDTLCTKHDAFTKKGFWLHERKSKLQNEDFENVLKWFSYISIFKGKYNFDLEYLKSILSEIKLKLNLQPSLEDLIYDLTVSISILIQDGTDYTFPHKSLQEYFTAYLIKGLNEEQKRKIYQEKFFDLRKFTNGGNLNLYKLCYELDKVCFSKYFLIPNAKDFLNLIDNTSDLELTKSFIRAFNLKINYHKDEDGNFRVAGHMYNYLPVDSFLAFFNLKSILPNLRTDENKSIEIIKNLLEGKILLDDNGKISNVKPLNIVEEWNGNIEEYVEKSGIVENFKQLNADIISNLKNIEDELEIESTNTKELLDI